MHAGDATLSHKNGVPSQYQFEGYSLLAKRHQASFTRLCLTDPTNRGHSLNSEETGISGHVQHIDRNPHRDQVGKPLFADWGRSNRAGRNLMPLPLRFTTC